MINGTGELKTYFDIFLRKVVFFPLASKNDKAI